LDWQISILLEDGCSKKKLKNVKKKLNFHQSVEDLAAGWSATERLLAGQLAWTSNLVVQT